MDYIDLDENTLELKNEPLASASWFNLIRLLSQNSFKVDLRYIPRVIYSFLIGGVVSPFRFLERRRFDKVVEDVEIDEPPIFLLGHWRSGTTFLHNLLSRDDRFGFFSTFDAYFPGVSLVGKDFFKPLVASSIPDKRPMDDVKMDVDLPQEEEYALGAFSPYSYYHGWCFPRNMDFYSRLVCMDEVPEWMVEEWKRLYLYLLRKATFVNGGKRLVLKNQSNTARVKLLLDLFPDAKFVHIYRNPYHVYFSMMRFMRMVIPLYCLQCPPPLEQVEDSMMDLYADMYRRYFRERELVPDGNLVEVCYEDFSDSPLDGVRRIYDVLGLEGFEDAEDGFRDYLFSQGDVRVHEYDVGEDVRSKVYGRWGFVFDEFGYDR